MTAGEIELIIRARDLASQQLRATEATLETMGGAASRVGGSMARAGAATEKAFVTAFQSVQKQAAPAMASVSAFVGALGVGLSDILAPAGLAFFLGTVVKIGIAFDNLTEQSQLALTTILQSADAATAAMARFMATAAQTPFNVGDITNAGIELVAMGMSAEEADSWITTISDSLSAVGQVGPQALGSVTNAIAYMNAEGFASMGVINNLMAHHVDALGILAKQMGSSRIGVTMMISSGKIPAATILGNLKAGLDQQFGGQSARQVNTFQGALANLQDALSMLLGLLTRPMFEILTQEMTIAGNAVKGFLTWIHALPAPFRTFLRYVVMAATIVIPLAAAVIGLAVALAGLAVAALALVTLGPIVAIAYALVQAFGALQGVANDVASAIGGLFSNAVITTIDGFVRGSGAALLALLNRIGLLIATVQRSWNSAWYLMDAAFKVVYKRIQPILDWLNTTLHEIDDIMQNANDWAIDVKATMTEKAATIFDWLTKTAPKAIATQFTHDLQFVSWIAHRVFEWMTTKAIPAIATAFGVGIGFLSWEAHQVFDWLTITAIPALATMFSHDLQFVSWIAHRVFEWMTTKAIPAIATAFGVGIGFLSWEAHQVFDWLTITAIPALATMFSHDLQFVSWIAHRVFEWLTTKAIPDLNTAFNVGVSFVSTTAKKIGDWLTATSNDLQLSVTFRMFGQFANSVAQWFYDNWTAIWSVVGGGGGSQAANAQPGVASRVGSASTAAALTVEIHIHGNVTTTQHDFEDSVVGTVIQAVRRGRLQGVFA